MWLSSVSVEAAQLNQLKQHSGSAFTFFYSPLSPYLFELEWIIADSRIESKAHINSNIGKILISAWESQDRVE